MWVNCSSHQKIANSEWPEENMSYDDQIQSASPRVLVLDYTRLGICVKTVDTMFELKISSKRGIWKRNYKDIWQKEKKRLEKSSSGVYRRYTCDECNSLFGHAM